jgi:ATP-dependent Lon protease
VLEAYQIWAKVDFSTLPEGPRVLPDIKDPGILADAVAPLLQVSIEQRQALLETRDVVTRLKTILALLKAAQQAA